MISLSDCTGMTEPSLFYLFVCFSTLAPPFTRSRLNLHSAASGLAQFLCSVAALFHSNRRCNSNFLCRSRAAEAPASGNRAQPSAWRVQTLRACFCVSIDMTTNKRAKEREREKEREQWGLGKNNERLLEMSAERESCARTRCERREGSGRQGAHRRC